MKEVFLHKEDMPKSFADYSFALENNWTYKDYCQAGNDVGEVDTVNEKDNRHKNCSLRILEEYMNNKGE